MSFNGVLGAAVGERVDDVHSDRVEAAPDAGPLFDAYLAGVVRSPRDHPVAPPVPAAPATPHATAAADLRRSTAAGPCT